MTQEFHAPPHGTVFRDDPFGHALIGYYKPWLLANAFNHDIVVATSGDSLEGIFSDGRYSNYIENRKWLPWTVLKTNESLSYLFIQDTELPMAVPPIGTIINGVSAKKDYPDFCKKTTTGDYFFEQFCKEIIRHPDYASDWEVIAHPPHSVVVPFVEPVEDETETPKISEEPTVTKQIITTMQKILRPEVGQKINTPEEVKKFFTFLQLHTDCSKSDTSLDYVITTGFYRAKAYAFSNNLFLPYTVNGVNPEYGDIFITEAELAQAEAEAKQAYQELQKTKPPLEQRVAKLETLVDCILDTLTRKSEKSKEIQ